MYKLVVIGGDLRGEEFILKNGENILGRASDCDVIIDLNGISKNHVSLAVTNDVVYVKDLGSANGTFVNSKMIKRATIKNGDNIALPDCVIQLVEVKEKKIIIKKTIQKNEIEDPFYPKIVPKEILPKLIFLFKYKLMPVIYGINQEYEWRFLIGILVAIFSVVTISLTIFPILLDSRSILIAEIAKRGTHFAEEIARLNFKALEMRDLDRINTAFLEKESGVKSYELFDLQGRIVRPLEKLNTHISDPFSIGLMESSTIQKGLTVRKLLDDGSIGIGRKIIAYNPKLGDYEGVGIISIKFAPESLIAESARRKTAYLEALVTTFIVAIIFFAIVYYLTLRPIEELRFQIDDALRGDRKSLEGKFLMNEISPLRNSVNSLLQRLRELQGGESEDSFDDMEGDEMYVSSLKEFLRGTPGPALVLDSLKNVSGINGEGEELLGIRESSSEGQSFAEICREEGIAGTILGLCDDSASNNGTCKNGHYELQGTDFEVNVVSLIGKDSFAKAFLVTFIREG